MPKLSFLSWIKLALAAVFIAGAFQQNATAQVSVGPATIRDGVEYVEGKPFLKLGAFFGYNNWGGTEKGSLGNFVAQPMSQVGTASDFYSAAGFNSGMYSVRAQWLNQKSFDPTLLQAATQRAKKAGQKISLQIWCTPSEAVCAQMDLHWINSKGEKVPFEKTLGIHHDPAKQAEAIVRTYKSVFDEVRDNPTIIDYQIAGERWPYDYIRVKDDVSFDDYSMGRFREYLKSRYTLPQLSERYGGTAAFYKSWQEVTPPIQKPRDFSRRDLKGWELARWDWFRFRKAQTVEVWVAMIEALQKLDARGRPFHFEHGHGPYYSMGFNPFPEIVARTKGFSVGDGDFHADLAGMTASMIQEKGCGNGPWINNELNAGTAGGLVDAAWLRRHIWGHLALGAGGYNIWTFVNLMGLPFEFASPNYNPMSVNNLPLKYFEVQHSNAMIRSLGDELPKSKSPPASIALMLLDDSIYLYTYTLSYHPDSDNITRAMTAHGRGDQLTLYTEYHLDETNLTGIKMIVLPRTPRITDAHAKKLADFVSRGGTLVLMGPTAKVDEKFTAYSVFPYGPLAAVAGVKVSELSAAEVGSAPVTAEWKGQPIHLDVTTSVMIPPDSRAEVIVSKDGKPLVTRNAFGKGQCFFFAGYPFLLDDADSTGALIAGIADAAGSAAAAVLKEDGRVDTGVFLGRRVSSDGTLLFAVENDNRDHDLEVALNPATLGLDPGKPYSVFECFSEESHNVGGKAGWSFPTRLEAAGVRIYFIGDPANYAKAFPEVGRLKVPHSREGVLADKRGPAGTPYLAEDIVKETLRNERSPVVCSSDLCRSPSWLTWGKDMSALTCNHSPQSR